MTTDERGGIPLRHLPVRDEGPTLDPRGPALDLGRSARFRGCRSLLVGAGLPGERSLATSRDRFGRGARTPLGRRTASPSRRVRGRAPAGAGPDDARRGSPPGPLLSAGRRR